MCEINYFLIQEEQEIDCSVPKNIGIKRSRDRTKPLLKGNKRLWEQVRGITTKE